jgi:hypothetical protein
LAQPKGFAVKEKEHMRCHLKKYIYGLNKASRQWYLKFDKNIRNFDFKENEEDNCIMQSSGMGNLFFLSCMCMIFYLSVAMLVYC